MKNENVILSNEELQIVTGGKGAWQLSWNIIAGIWVVLPGSWVASGIWCALANTLFKECD